MNISFYAFKCHGCGKRVPRGGKIVHFKEHAYCCDRCHKKQKTAHRRV